MDSEKNVQVVVHSGAVDGRKVPDSLGNDIEQEREEEEESRSVIFSDSSLASAMNCAMLSSRKKSLGKRSKTLGNKEMSKSIKVRLGVDLHT